MASAGIVALKFVIDLCRGLKLFFQTVGAYEGGGTKHPVKIADLFGDLDVGCGIVHLLCRQFVTKDDGKILGG